MERNINVISVSVIKDQARTYPAGCDQWLTFPVIETGEYRVITDISNTGLPQCNNAAVIGSVVPANEFPPMTNVLTVRVIDPIIGAVYVDKTSYDAAKATWNNCCSTLPAIGTPANFTATNGNAQSVINWDDVTGAVNYVLERATNIGFTANLTTVYTGTTSGYTNTGLTNGTQYYYRVQAIANPAVASDSAYAFTNATPTLPTLAMPAGFAATPGSSEIALDWADVASATNYIVDRALDSGFTTGVALAVYSGATSAYTNTGLTPATPYYFRVRAQAAGFLDSPYAYVNGTPTA